MVAVRYYSTGKHPEFLFRSFYSLGCIYNESGQLIDAAVALGQAEQLAHKIDDSFRLGLLYSQLGDVFLKSYDFHRSEKFFRMAYDYYNKSNKESHSIHALFDIGECLIQIKKYNEAHSIFEYIKEWADKNEDCDLKCRCLLNQLLCSLQTDNKELAISESNKFFDNKTCLAYNSYVFSLFAKYYILISDTAYASSNIREGWALASSKSDSINLLYCESLLDEMSGRLDDALEKYKETIELQNQNLYKLLDQPILGAQKDYYKNIAEAESLRISRNKRTFFSFLFAFLLIMVILIQITRSRRLQYEADKADLLLTIKDLKLKEDSNNETINRLSSRVNDLFSRPYEELDDIFDKMMETDDLIELQTNALDTTKKEVIYYRRVDEFYKHVKEKFDEMISYDNQKELDRIIDSACNNIMTRLEDDNFNLTKQDLLILRLSIVGFSLNTISRLTNIRYKTVHQQRRRAIQKIAVISEELANEVSNVLKMR
jgi:tetratricopeptide (TPR) repeat protein/DNA-binding CsgD family transcriptional regulator